MVGALLVHAMKPDVLLVPLGPLDRLAIAIKSLPASRNTNSLGPPHIPQTAECAEIPSPRIGQSLLFDKYPFPTARHQLRLLVHDQPSGRPATSRSPDPGIAGGRTCV